MARQPHAHAYVSTSPCACPLFLRPSCPTSLPRTSCTPSIQITSPIPAPPPAAPTTSALRTRTIPYTLSCPPAPPRPSRPPLPSNVAWLNEAETGSDVETLWVPFQYAG
ncbi:hypothetical protein C8J57DRAFT_1495821 [Mycena rebaudengoi]|nr:hypothetical protein C8J57DRAFT_1495821 [Mycena rebaudengoi]